MTSRPPSSPAIYVAAPLSEVWAAEKIANVLQSAGYRITSTWHGLLGNGAKDPLDAGGRREALQTCLQEIQRCSVLVAWTATGKPKMTYAEIATSLALGRRVVWLQGPDLAGASIQDADPRVTVLLDVTEEALLEAVAKSCQVDALADA